MEGMDKGGIGERSGSMGEEEGEGENAEQGRRMAGQGRGVTGGRVGVRRGNQSLCGSRGVGRMEAEKAQRSCQEEAKEGGRSGSAVWSMRVEHHWQAHAFEVWSCCFDKWREQVRGLTGRDGKGPLPGGCC